MTDATPARPTVADQRGYAVPNVAAARALAAAWLRDHGLAEAVAFGLPEVDDRYHVWRIPLLYAGGERLGEAVVDAREGLVDEQRSTAPSRIADRLHHAPAGGAGRGGDGGAGGLAGSAGSIRRSPLDSAIIFGDARDVLFSLPAGSADLVFTSPPYYNARPQYTEYAAYEDYLGVLRRVFQGCHHVLADGRFIVVNVAPVLLRRTSRGSASRRIAVPFDVHRLLVEEGFDFVDDIIWKKPAGAGWATGRGRRFAADRQPLQYKAVPVTEYVLVYRRHTAQLLDWNIREHHDAGAVARSRIDDDYERTNVWEIKPVHDPRHPAVFPRELAERVIRYYSFLDDVVLDPFAGIGTTAHAAEALGRRYVMIERDEGYFEAMRAAFGERAAIRSP